MAAKFDGPSAVRGKPEPQDAVLKWTLGRRLLTAVVSGAAAICMIVAIGSPAAAFQQRYTYRVHDSIYGAIGTYSNDVEKTGHATTVTTQASIKVSLLGITLYNQAVSRIERWVDDRLVFFHGLTVENGQPIEVDGRAEADAFIVNSPQGTVFAPATIRSVNPWSASAPGGDALLMPDTGLVEKVRGGACEDASVAIDGASKQARRCQIETANGRVRYEVWIDEAGTPVMFSMQNNTSTVTFTLVR